MSAMLENGHHHQDTLESISTQTVPPAQLVLCSVCRTGDRRVFSLVPYSLGPRAAFWRVRRTDWAGGSDWAVTGWFGTDLLNT